MVVAGLVYLVIGEILLPQLLKLFGAAAEVFPYARQYAGATLLGMPFLIEPSPIRSWIQFLYLCSIGAFVTGCVF